MNEIVKQETAVKEWSGDEIKLIQQTVAKNATPQEFKLFLYTAKHYALDPLVKQIWFVKYKPSEPGTIFVGRDGFLSIAHKSGQFDGMDTIAIKNEKGVLSGAKCTIWRKDMGHPISVEVSMSEYAKPYGNWKTMPETMIKKVAQSQALRQAFNISGVYSPEENWHDDKDEQETAPQIEEQQAEVIDDNVAEFDSIPDNPAMADDKPEIMEKRPTPDKIEEAKMFLQEYADADGKDYDEAEAKVLKGFCQSKGIDNVMHISDLDAVQLKTLETLIRRKTKEINKKNKGE